MGGKREGNSFQLNGMLFVPHSISNASWSLEDLPFKILAKSNFEREITITVNPCQ